MAANLDEICTLVVEVAREAGGIIRNARPTAQTTASKKNTADIVTETDVAVEKHIRERLMHQYPSFDFVGEESYKAGSPITDRPTFVVDPIDGTSNFVHGFPAVCVSIGLVVDRRPAVGVVYNPFTDELWNAVKGGGAFASRHGEPRRRLGVAPAPLDGLTTACVGIEWGSKRAGPGFDLNLHVFTTLARTKETGGRFVNSLRCTGSAAVTICRVAAGQQEAFWECGCWAWDVAAAWCVLAEAGGIMVDGHPGDWDPPIDNRRYLAVRPAAGGQGEFVEEFWGVVRSGLAEGSDESQGS